MVRFILAATVLLVAAPVQAQWDYRFNDIDNHENLALASEILTRNLQPQQGVKLFVTGYLIDVEGNWEDGTAKLTGFFFPVTPVLLPQNHFEMPLRSDVDWAINGPFRVGVLRGGDFIFPEGNENLGVVDLQELNAVRNEFGRIALRPGDVTYDGRVDTDDLNMVRNHFGEASYWGWNSYDRQECDGNTSVGRRDCGNRVWVTSAVPEPSSAMLLAIAAFALSTHRGRVRR